MIERGSGFAGPSESIGAERRAASEPERASRRLSSRIRPALGLASLVCALVASAMALVWAPADAVQGEVQRVMYVHVPSAWTAYLAFVVVFLASVGWLWSKRRMFDAIAVASAEIGVLFTGLALVSGSIWAKPTWGVWWTWEPRLITTAVMFVMYVGYLLLRSLSTDVDGRATRAAVIGVVAVVNVPIVHLSVTWMNALHQLPTVLRPDGPALESRMLATLIVSVLAFTIVYAWLMVWRVALETARQERALSDLARGGPARSAPVLDLVAAAPRSARRGDEQ